MSDEVIRKARSAAGWTAIAKAFEAVASFASLLLLVRMLGPETYGIYGMLLVAIALPSGIVGGPLAECLIQRSDIHRGHEAATFFAETSIALLLAEVLIALTPWLAATFHEPLLLHVMPAMAFAPFVSALGAVPCALLQRQMRFKAMSVVDTLGTIAAITVGVVMAFSGFGVWSLVTLELTRRAVRTVGFWILAGWRLHLNSSLRDFRDLAHFNAYTIANRLLLQADDGIPGAFIGSILGAEALGYFNLARRLYTQASQILLGPLHAVALPAASQLSKSPEQLKRLFMEGLRTATAIAYPFFIGAAVVAPIFVPLLFGPEWTGTVLTVQLVMLMGARDATGTFNESILRGAGKPAAQAAISCLCLIILLIGSPIATTMGLNAVVIVILLRGIVGWLAGAWLLQRVMNLSLWRQIIVGWPSLVASIGMAATVSLVMRLCPPGEQPWLALFVAVLAGALSYAIVLSLLAPQLTRHVLRLARRRTA